DEALWGKDQALESGLDILSGQRSAIVKRHPLTQEKRIGSAVLRNLPTVGQVGDDGLPAVSGVTPDQVITHAALHTYAGARLMHIEGRRRAEEPEAKDPAALGMRLGRPQYKLLPIKRAGGLSSQT